MQCSSCEHTFTVFPGGEERARPTGPTPDDSTLGPSGAKTPVPRRDRSAVAPRAGLGGSGELAARKQTAPGARPAEPKMAPPGGGRLFLAQGDRIYKVKDIATLQRWVVEKRVLPNDRLSKDGKTWEVVKAVAELRPFFAVLDQLKQTKRALNDVRKAATGDALPAVPRAASQSVPIPRRASESSVAPQQRAIVGDAAHVSTSAATPTGAQAAELSEASRRVVEEVPATPPPMTRPSPRPSRADLPSVPSDAEASQGFFGAGVESGLVGEGDDSLDGHAESDFKSTRPIDNSNDSLAPDAAAASGFPSGLEGSGGMPVEKAARQTRSFPAAGATRDTAPPSDQLPPPESIQVPTQVPDADFDPNQTFSGDAYRPSPGAGLGFWVALLGLSTVGVFALWYFLMGPGAPAPTVDLPSGDGTAAVDPPEPTEATPEEATPEEATPEEATPEPTPEPAPEPTPAAKPAPKPEPRAVKPEPAPKPKPKPAASAAEHMKTGDRAADRGDFRGAARAYEAAIEAEPKNFRAAVQLGWSYVELGRNGDAIAIFSKATRMRPGSAEAHYGLGLAYQEAGQNGNAKTEYQKVIELDPNGRDAAEVKALLRRLE